MMHIANFLERTYTDLNLFLFDGKLPNTVFFKNDLTHKWIFRFYPSSKMIISVGSGFIKAEPIEILDDLLHNMVHIANWQKGITDHTDNQYHNLSFVNEALESGLFVVWHKTRGWGVTTSDVSSLIYQQAEKKKKPPQGAIEKRTRAYKKTVFFQDDFIESLKAYQEQIKLERKPNKQYQFKYVCQCDPPTIIRCGRNPTGDHPLRAKCLNCDAKFVLAT